MPHKRKMLIFMIPVFLLLSSLLSACQNGPTDQAQACNRQSSPIIKTLESVQFSSQMVYASNGYDLYAFNAGNGAPRWCSAISTGNGRDQFYGLAYNGENIYAYTNAGDIARFDAQSGTLLWSSNIENFAVDEFAPPSIVNTTVYGGRSSMYGLNTQDGSTHWQYSLPDKAYADFIPAVDGGSVYFSARGDGATHGQVYALNATTGNKRWIFSLPEHEQVWGQLDSGEGVVVVPYQRTSPDGAFHYGLDVLDAQAGKLLWQKAIGPTMFPEAANKSWAIINGLLYVIGEVPDNSTNGVTSLYAFDVHTGAIRWSVVTSDDTSNSSLFVANTILYRVDWRGKIDARNAQTGQLLWHAQLPAVSHAALLSQITILNDHLFIGTQSLDNNPILLLRAFNLNTHKEDWYANISGDAAQNSPAIVCV